MISDETMVYTQPIIPVSLYKYYDYTLQMHPALHYTCSGYGCLRPQRKHARKEDVITSPELQTFPRKRTYERKQ